MSDTTEPHWPLSVHEVRMSRDVFDAFTREMAVLPQVEGSDQWARAALDLAKAFGLDVRALCNNNLIVEDPS